jgi:hypothetical protein
MACRRTIRRDKMAEEQTGKIKWKEKRMNEIAKGKQEGKAGREKEKQEDPNYRQKEKQLSSL